MQSWFDLVADLVKALAGNIILIDDNKYVMYEWGRIAVIYVEGVITCISMAGPTLCIYTHY